MPYIPLDDRRKFATSLECLERDIKFHGISNGELNFLITTLSLMYIEEHGLTYNTGSDIIKALECAKLEFYDRVMRPYEDTKNKQNGDVYGSILDWITKKS